MTTNYSTPGFSQTPPLTTQKTIRLTGMSFIKFFLSLASILIPVFMYVLPDYKNFFWDVTLIAVFLLMIIRPIGYLLPRTRILRLLPLRKHLGIFSATIVVAFGLFHYLDPAFAWRTYFTLAYWSFENNLFWAHLGELTGFILLITSNRFSQRLLRRNWKRIQRLSYVYFFSGSWFVFASFQKPLAFIGMIIVFELTLLAFIKKRLVKKRLQ